MKTTEILEERRSNSLARKFATLEHDPPDKHREWYRTNFVNNRKAELIEESRRIERQLSRSCVTVNTGRKAPLISGSYGSGSVLGKSRFHGTYRSFP